MSGSVLSTAMFSKLYQKPQLFIRKNENGSKLDGYFKMNQKCLIIDDFVSSGTSILKTAEVIK